MEYSDDTILNSGKYRNTYSTFKYVFENDKDYVLWILGLKNITSGLIKAFKLYIEEKLKTDPLKPRKHLFAISEVSKYFRLDSSFHKLLEELKIEKKIIHKTHKNEIKNIKEYEKGSGNFGVFVDNVMKRCKSLSISEEPRPIYSGRLFPYSDENQDLLEKAHDEYKSNKKSEDIIRSIWLVSVDTNENNPWSDRIDENELLEIEKMAYDFNIPDSSKELIKDVETYTFTKMKEHKLVECFGADCFGIRGTPDLVVENILIDFKVYWEEFGNNILDFIQLILYAICGNNNTRNKDKGRTKIDTLIIYNPLFGCEYIVNMSKWTKEKEVIEYIEKFKSLNPDD